MDQNLTDIETAVNAQLAALSAVLNPDGSLKPGSVNTAAIQDRAVTQAKLAFLSGFYAVDTGGANAMAIAFTPALTAYAAGLIFYVKAAATNTGPTTINVNGVGLQDVKTFDGLVLSPMAAGQIVIGNVYLLVYDGAEFLVLNPSDPGATTGPVFFPGAAIALNPGGTIPQAWTDIDLSVKGPVPATAKAVILICVNQVTDPANDGQILTEVKPDNAGSVAQIACQMGGIHGTGTEGSQQGIYPIGLVAGVPHVWFRVTNTTTGTSFLSLIGYIA
jgi:hypothetical protein